MLVCVAIHRPTCAGYAGSRICKSARKSKKGRRTCLFGNTHTETETG